MDINELVAIALSNHAPVPRPKRGVLHPVDPARFTHGLVSALGWIVASEIVTAFHAEYGMDAIPHFHPELGWDRFHLTRRVPQSGSMPIPVGAIDVGDDRSPSITMAAGGETIALGDLLLNDPERAVSAALDHVRPSDRLGDCDFSPWWERQRRIYPLLYGAMTELLLEHPGTIVARELFIDDEQIGGAFHPLFLHGDGAGPHLTYDWFLIQQGERCVFISNHGGQVVYEREPGVWAAIGCDLTGKTLAAVKDRIAVWLGLGSESEPARG